MYDKKNVNLHPQIRERNSNEIHFIVEKLVSADIYADGHFRIFYLCQLTVSRTYQVFCRRSRCLLAADIAILHAFPDILQGKAD